MSALNTYTNGVAGAGNDEARRAHAAVTATVNTAHAQAAAITSRSDSPARVRMLVSRMDERLAAMQHQIADTHASNRVFALRLRQLAARYRQAAPDRKPSPDG